MSLDQPADERSVEASAARVARAVEQGQGPRAPWLAAACSGLLALVVLGVAAGPLAAGAMSWLRAALQGSLTQEAPLAWSAVLWPALVGPLSVLVAVAGGHGLAHGGWVKLASWRRGRRPTLAARLRSVTGGWLLALAAVLGGGLAALPWLSSLTALGGRSWPGALWALGAFAVSVALGALGATAVCGLVQRRAARVAFERSMRMTPAEAREAARQEGAVRRPKPRLSRWRSP